MTLTSGKRAQDRLFELLPAIYRVRDAEQREPLRALLAVIEAELLAVEEDIDGLYDDWFIETCAEWLVPYIGDLLGVRPLSPIEEGGAHSLRAYVANTLTYRRRKGTATVLEQLARDVSGWPARAAEFFQNLTTTQHLNHLRPDNLLAPDLRDTNQLDLLGTPFETAAYTAEVGHISRRRGKYNIPNVGLFLWRLQPYSVKRATARPVVSPADGRYTFNPFGLDSPLFNPSQGESAISQLAGEEHVPGPLRRRPMFDELEALRQAIADGKAPPGPTYFGANPSIRIFVDGAADPIPAAEIAICDLHDIDGGADWRPVPAEKSYKRLDKTTDPPTPVEVLLPVRVAVDPERGRLAFPAGIVPGRVEVAYTYGLSSDVGGGPYSRRESGATDNPTWHVRVGQQEQPVPEQVFNTMSEAILAWVSQPPGTVGLIEVLDSRTYEEDLRGDRTIVISEGSQLMIMAQDRLHPHILGDVSIKGIPDNSDNPGRLVLDGLWIQGQVRVLVGNLGGLDLKHCTLVPDAGGLTVNRSVSDIQGNRSLRLSIERSVLGPISLTETVPALHLKDSIVDAVDTPEAIAGQGATIKIQSSTVIGTTSVRRLNADDSIFTGLVTVERRQVDCIRFSYVPEGSSTPRCYRCQPDLALSGVSEPNQQRLIRSRLVPMFTSTTCGDPAYGQLRQDCPSEISAGAEDGSEMGAFSHLKQPQREGNLRAALNEYLRFGLEAGIFYVT